MVPGKPTGTATSGEVVSKILRTVSVAEAFHFYTDVEQYSGEFAASLEDFSQKLKTVPIKSVEFHFRRGDFERWIREMLGDEYLAKGISRIDKSVKGEALRTAIVTNAESRLYNLKRSR